MPRADRRAWLSEYYRYRGGSADLRTTALWSRSCHGLTGVPGSQSTTGTGGSADLRTTVVQVMPRADRRAWLSEYYRYRRIS